MNVHLSRRRFMAWSALAAAAGFARFPLEAAASVPGRVKPFALHDVRLKPSMFLDSLQTNGRYLQSLEPDRLLHNFRRHAGLEPKADVYGGWEADTIAGHTLGHYLSALSLMHAQTGDMQCRRRADYIVAELALCQSRSGDGYVAGFTRKNEAGEIENGRMVFEELARGDIRPAAFYLNGSWAPLYTWHKLFAGLLDAHAHCGNAQALAVAEKLGGYVDGVFAQLDDDQVQQVLSCEFGGLNESFAELHARTGDVRWLKLAERLRHREVMDPLVAQQDKLARLHANTQIPKLIGMARQFELTGDPEPAAAARFFWHTVVAHHTYAIGGNADREYFQAPDSISEFITEQTCEHCNSYNMLKLTRHLYQWTPQASYFDYYERALLNHVMAQQHPETGMFAYMMPLMSGEARSFSRPFDDFWCCVGSGMESHAQFGDSIYWQGEDALFVNLYIPSKLDWAERGMALELDSTLPLGGTAALRVVETSARMPTRIALRIPAWAAGWTLKLNGRAIKAEPAEGYASVERRWRAGDTLSLELPLDLRLEATADDPRTVAILRGPLVMAADLGASTQPYDAPDPVLVADGDVLQGFQPQEGQPGHYLASAVARPGPLGFAPFYAQHDRRSAVYFKLLDPAGWQQAQAAKQEETQALERLNARAVDSIQLGEESSEQAHGLRSDSSYSLSYRRRSGRDARTGGHVEFDLRAAPGPLTLRMRYWGGEYRRRFRILANGRQVAFEVLDGKLGNAFVDVDYPVPAAALKGNTLRIRIEPEKGYSAGPVFGCWLLA
ncbi:beta-L-arabinofuranosidase domain-containing protein [Pseudoxanthomonas wuyuanensis]